MVKFLLEEKVNEIKTYSLQYTLNVLNYMDRRGISIREIAT
ncbi:hypothetical protein IKS_01654 [Bacillus cereus VDM062]|jgi:hypothetical protein|nr:hypothetical protein IKO_03414 [Bacillus cereus VDM034]EJS14995.1 hypothetical protein IKS_01654 [Bacillus cereus VDM062]